MNNVIFFCAFLQFPDCHVGLRGANVGLMFTSTYVINVHYLPIIQDTFVTRWYVLSGCQVGRRPTIE